jgi:hypothetical protein
VGLEIELPMRRGSRPVRQRARHRHLPDAFLAMLLCTCDRWGRVTARLIAAIERSGILTGADLDELAESFLSEEVVIGYPFLWACPQGLDLGSSDEGAPGFVVDENTMAKTRRRPEPPLRRWAAARALRHDPGRLDDLLASTGALAPRHREAALRRASADANRAVRAWRPTTPAATGRGAASGRAAPVATLDPRGADRGSGPRA